MANRTGKGGLAEHPENRNRNGQRNKEAVAFARSLRELLVTEGNKSHTVTLDNKSVKAKKIAWMIRSIWSKAMAGEPWAVQFIAERVEGKVKEQIELDANVALKTYQTVSPDDWDTETV